MSEQVQDERLMSLEGAVREMIASNERVVVKTEVLGEKVEKGFEDLARSHVVLEEKTKNLEKRIVPFEERKVKFDKRTESLKKFIIPAIAGTAGIVGTKFGVQLLHIIGAFFGAY